jgi:F0F1-type ATP synthase membrane subunit b/b'
VGSTGFQDRAIRVVADAQIEKQEQALLTTAEEEHRRISENVQREVAGAAERTRNELKEFAADLAVSIARHVIQMDESTDQHLIRAFVTALDQADKITAEHLISYPFFNSKSDVPAWVCR